MRVASVAALVLAVAVLAGCGGGGASSNGVASKSPNEILAAAKAAATQAAATHIVGSIQEGTTPLTLDLHLVTAKGGTGHMSENGVGFDIIRVGNKAYVRGSAAFYKKFAGPAAAKLLEGKWLVGSTTSGRFVSLTPLTDLETFFTTALGQHDTLTKTAVTTVNGQKVIGLKDGANGGTIYIATTGKPYPIELVSPGNGKEGTLSFDQWNKTVTIVAPKNAVDISKLGG